MKMMRIGAFLLAGYTATGVLMMLSLPNASRPVQRAAHARQR